MHNTTLISKPDVRALILASAMLAFKGFFTNNKLTRPRKLVHCIQIEREFECGHYEAQQYGLFRKIGLSILILPKNRKNVVL